MTVAVFDAIAQGHVCHGVLFERRQRLQQAQQSLMASLKRLHSLHRRIEVCCIGQHCGLCGLPGHRGKPRDTNGQRHKLGCHSGRKRQLQAAA